MENVRLRAESESAAGRQRQTHATPSHRAVASGIAATICAARRAFVAIALNEAVDELITLGLLSRVPGQTEATFSNSLIEAWWRVLKHQ